MSPRPPMLTLKEVAQFLSLSEKTVYRLVETGTLPALKIGGQWRFVQSSLDAWVTDRLSESAGDRWKRRRELVGRKKNSE